MLFFGVKDFLFVMVFVFKYCEEVKLWFSVEVIIVLNVVVLSDNELILGVLISESKFRSSVF